MVFFFSLELVGKVEIDCYTAWDKQMKFLVVLIKICNLTHFDAIMDIHVIQTELRDTESELLIFTIFKKKKKWKTHFNVLFHAKGDTRLKT